MTQEEYYDQALILARIGALEVLDVNDAAVMLRITPDRVRHLASERKIPHYRNRNNMRLYFRKRDLEAWMAAERIPTIAETEAVAVTKVVTQRKRL